MAVIAALLLIGGPVRAMKGPVPEGGSGELIILFTGEVLGYIEPCG
jgi:hypothetical protein